MPATLPSLFVPHGAPSFALAPGAAGAALAAVAARLPRPEAIVVVSAHWDTDRPRVGAALHPATIHDFSGFPEALYRLRYPAPGAAALAVDVRNLLDDAGLEAVLDTARGLDHGAWVPLRLMYPAADIPVVPVSLQSGRGPAHHLRLGAALAPLARRGVLVAGSGNLSHNLRDVRWQGAAAPLPYVAEFQAWLAGRLAEGDAAALLDYRRRSPAGRAAHPSEEHLLPLFVALGAAGAGARAERFSDSVELAAIAMDGYAFHPAPG